jgi:bifunctional non-homologous end joining protein LigD
MEVVTLKFSPVVPFEPISTEVLPTGDQWISQVKWDGVRISVYYDGHNVSLMNRRLNNRTLQFPELTDIQKFCSAES